MSMPSADVTAIQATLDAAEASLRSLAAQALSPAALLRAERRAALAAREQLDAVRAERRIDLDPGWAEFVDVDAEIDALLARLHIPEPPLPPAAVSAVPDVPDLPPEAAAEGTAAALADDDDVPDYAAAEPADDDASEDDLPSYAANAAQPSPYESEDDDVPSYADQGGYSEDGDWQQDAYDYSGWSDPGDGSLVSFASGSSTESPAAAPEEEDLPSYAVSAADRPDATLEGEPEPEPEPEPAPQEDEWAFDHDEEYSSVFDPYAALAAKPKQRLAVPGGLDSFETDPAESPAQVEPPPVASVGLPDPKPAREPAPEPQPAYVYDDEDDDDLSEATQITSHSELLRAAAEPNPSGTSGAPRSAAIKLGDDGTATPLVSPATPEYDPEADDGLDEGSMIALGDAFDYGEDGVESAPGGGFGVSSVQYDDSDDDEDLGSVEDLASAEVHSIPGAPELSDGEVKALFAHAEETARRDMTEAAALFGDVLDANPGHIEALLHRGRLYLDLGDFARAVSDFLKAENVAPDNADAQAALGDLFYNRKDYRKAISYYNNALASDPKHAMALFRRGMAHYSRKQYQEAQDDLERAKKLDRSIPGLDMYLSRAKQRRG